MAYVDRMEGQDYIDKFRQYLDYLQEHLEFVRVAFINVSDACEGMPWVGDDFSWHSMRSAVMRHDLSKFSAEEFTQYRAQFFPVNDDDKQSSGFAPAWENHKQKNHHHHETAHNYFDIIHMVIDWTAMGYKFGDTARSYYEKNKERIAIPDGYEPMLYEMFDKIDKHKDQR